MKGWVAHSKMVDSKLRSISVMQEKHNIDTHVRVEAFHCCIDGGAVNERVWKALKKKVEKEYRASPNLYLSMFSSTLSASPSPIYLPSPH